MGREYTILTYNSKSKTHITECCSYKNLKIKCNNISGALFQSSYFNSSPDSI